VEEEEINYDYSKYLGPDYDRNPPKNTIIGNHSSYMDTIYLGCKQYPAFVSKTEIKKLPIFGLVTIYMRSIFVDRSGGKSAWEEVKWLLKERQMSIAGGHSGQIAVFPEGTTTNNRCIIQFKKGAFDAMVPVQPFCFRYLGPFFIPTFEAINPIACMVVNMCLPYSRLRVKILPVFKPTDYLFEKYQHLGNDKA
jgi:lysophosphatidylcholine acyltransferase/lyso-PAF acetyltransferase